MSAAYDLFQQGRSHLRSGMPAQATVALEKAKRLEPEKASIREALVNPSFLILRGGGGSRVPQGARAVAGRRLRPLRARTRAPQPGPPRRGREAPQARALAPAPKRRRARARGPTVMPRYGSRSATSDAYRRKRGAPAARETP